MKLITWNVQWFCALDDVVSVERVVAEAHAMADFDVLCLQEVAVNYPRLEGNAGFDQVVERSDAPLVQPEGPHEGASDIAFAASAVETPDGILLYYSQSDQHLRRVTIRRLR